MMHACTTTVDALTRDDHMVGSAQCIRIHDRGNIIHALTAPTVAPPPCCSPLPHRPTKPPITIHSTNKLLAPPSMSHTHNSASSNFQLIINNALDNYKKYTKNDLTTHPLTAQLQSCNSPGDILAILHQQIHELDQSRSTDERWSRWLDPTVNVIYVLSSTLAAGVSMVCPKT